MAACATRHWRTSPANALSGLCSNVVSRSARNAVKVAAVTASGSIRSAEQNRKKRDTPTFTERASSCCHSIAHAGDKLFWQVDERYWQRHVLRPGITGLAQVRGLRGATEHETDLSSRLQADLEYLAGWNILRDVRIVFATIGVLASERAY